jgi:hypothetical protein
MNIHRKFNENPSLVSVVMEERHTKGYCHDDT